MSPARQRQGRIAGFPGAHPLQRDGMCAAGTAQGSHRFGAYVELPGPGLHPAGGKVGVRDLGRVGVLRGEPEVYGHDHYAAGGEGRVHKMVGGTVVQEPSAAVNVRQTREWAFAPGLVDGCLQAAALVFRIDHIGSSDLKLGCRVVFNAGHGLSLCKSGRGTRTSLPQPDEVCHALAYRQDRDVDVGPDALGHDRGVNDPQTVRSVNLAVLVHHGHGV